MRHSSCQIAKSESDAMNQTFDRLFEILSSTRFLRMEGLANEVPIFIKPYKVEDEEVIAPMIRSLGQRLKAAGIKVAEIDLFTLLLEELKNDGLLDDLIRDEATFGKEELLETLKNYADSRTRVVPRLVDVMQQSGNQMTLITGVGHVFPFLRAHTLLDSIQPAMMRHPLVMFFPGEYQQMLGVGSQLRLFGSLPAKGYYRAFNLDHYQLPTS